MSDLLHAVELSIEPWGERLWQASWHSAVVLAVAWAIARWCTFLSPRVICWVLRLACLKLVVALFWVEPIGVPLLPATPAETVSRETLGPPATTALSSAEEPPMIERYSLVGQIDPQPRAVPYRIDLPPLSQSLWLAGVCGCVMITIGRWISIRGLCRAADPTRSVALQHAFRTEAQRLGIRRLPRLRVSPRADGPLLAGIGRPTIVLPNRAEESFDESELRLMLAHELAHLKRRDLLWNWLPTIVGWLFWFHPLVWLVKRRWSEAQEAACDEMLIQNHAARPAEYGRLLLKLAARWPQRSDVALIAVGMFGSYRNLERRILTMARVRVFSLPRLVIAAAIVSLVAVPGMVPWRLVAQEPDRAAPPAVKSPTISAPTLPAGNLQPQSDAAAAKSLHSQAQDPKFMAAAGRGLAAFEKGDYAQALVHFDEAIRLDPNYSEARRWRGDAFLNQGAFDKALSAYEDAIRLDPKNAMAYASRGMAWTEKREPNKALDDFQRAIQLRPWLASTPPYDRYMAAAKSLRSQTQNPKFTAAAKRGLAAFEKGDYAQALVHFDGAIRLDPQHSEARRWRGDAFLNQGAFDKALSAYDDAIRLDPKNAMAYASRGMAWTEKREPNKALDDFQRAIQLRPWLASTPPYDRYVAAARSQMQNPKFTAAAQRGMDAFKKRDFAQALVHFDEMIRLDPQHSEARRWRGDALLNQGEFDKALAAYEDAIRLDPKNAMAYVSRGMAWTEKGEPGPALIAFETAVGLDPKQAERPLFKRYVAAAQSLLTSSPIAGFGHPKKETSPFAAVRWQGSQPEVRVGDEWFKLVSLDGIPASEIVAFSRRNFGDRWKMRFEEDLVELLTQMGHPPKDTATLVVQPMAPSETRTLKDVPMTAANRWAIKAAADARKTSHP